MVALTRSSRAGSDGGRLAPALVAKDVRKSYGGHPALAGVSLNVVPGRLTSLLGPNGAGKTTLLEVIVGLRRADSGAISVLGRPMPGLTTRMRRRIGIVLQSQSLPPLLEVGEYLRMVAAAYRVPLERDGLFAELGLAETSMRRIGRLSGGQQRKLALVAALTGSPDLLILDEPTANLDPFSRLAFWQALRRASDHSARPCAILMATHDMAEATMLSSDVVILEAGSIRARGTPDALIDRYGQPAQLLVPVTDVPGLSRDLASAAGAGGEAAKLAARVELLRDEAGRPIAVFPPNDLDRVLQSALRPHLEPDGLRRRRSTLEDVFVALLGPRKDGGGA